MKRAYELTLNGTVYRLRLTARAQKKLIKEYGQQAAQVCVDGFADLDKLCSVLNELLHWSGRGNPELSGEDFCGLLVDEGYARQKAARRFPRQATLYYLFPLARLWVLQSIWQLEMSVAPPLLHAVTWSASISLYFQIRRA